jgi:EAL domain-containing protein (putative c-di-GMP-specific phosphodiesterase class I)
LAFLRKLPLNEVKIDRAFVSNLQVDVANQAIVRACVTIAGTTSMRVCAEGVETDEEMAAVTDLGCDYAQGFLLGRPMSIAALLAIKR